MTGHLESVQREAWRIASLDFSTKARDKDKRIIDMAQSHPANPFFRPEDLDKFELSFEIKNITSGRDLKFFFDVSHVLELQDKGIVIQVPPKSCALGHTLFLNFHIKNKNKKQTSIDTHMEITGKVRSLKKSHESKQIACIDFWQYDVDAWTQLLKKINEKRDWLNELISTTKR